MRITESSLRRIVRQEVLREAQADEAEIKAKIIAWLQTPAGEKAMAAIQRSAQMLKGAGVIEEGTRWQDRSATFAATGLAFGPGLLYMALISAGIIAPGASAFVITMLAGMPIMGGAGAVIDYLTAGTALDPARHVDASRSIR